MATQRQSSIISLIFIYCIISSTSSAQVGTNYKNFDEISSSDHNPSFCISDEYIMQAYFNTHSSLNDSEFENFLLLNVLIRLIAISLLQHRNITGEGSHRNLITSTKLLLQLESQLNELVIIERLPLGVFADPFEF